MSEVLSDQHTVAMNTSANCQFSLASDQLINSVCPDPRAHTLLVEFGKILSAKASSIEKRSLIGI